MFGYLQLYKDELKYKYIKEYKTYYCSICNGLRKNYGLFFSLFLNYETVFLYLFLDGVVATKRKVDMNVRCPLNPFSKVRTKIDSNLLNYSCFTNYYLALKKMEDNYNDERKIIYKILFLYINSRKKYKKDKEKYSALVEALEKYFKEFNRYEKEGEHDIDILSESMGKILETIMCYYMEMEDTGGDREKKIVRELGFHLGKWIYLIDAFEDLKEDIKKRRYNPLVAFLDNPKGNDVQYGYVVEMTLIMLNLATKKLQVLKSKLGLKEHEEIINNILCFALENKIKDICVRKYRGELIGKEVKQNGT